MVEEYQVKRIRLEDLRADQAGLLVSHLSTLICDVFSEPPWLETYAHSRILFGLGVEMMRKNAILFIAQTNQSNKIIGYILGQELLKFTDDERNQTLSKISSGAELDKYIDDHERVFYVGGLGVIKDYRRMGVAEKLSENLILELKNEGFNYRLGRTDLAADKMRKLYIKQGFDELPVRDGVHSNRSYWLLRL
jgi:ribosomal protein S18 acetylase RimI-like enzyme